MEISTDTRYQNLLAQLSELYVQGRGQALQAVNAQLIETYWQLGRHIVEFEQSGQARAEYGKALLNQLARDLTLRHGRGFSRSNLIYMRLFYQRYPISEKPSHQLSIGIILSRHKDELLVEYATYQLDSQLFVQKYQLYLPDREALQQQLEITLREAETLPDSNQVGEVTAAGDGGGAL